ncbi:MAG: undecaprenyl-diphosphate phosphatase [Clostridia bacterium]
MKILQSIILGLIQGLTEFLPVSSSGHLIVCKKLFGIDQEQFGLTFDIALHFATLIAVFIVFWPDILAILKKPVQKLTGLLIVATIPAVLVGLFLDDYIESISQSGGFLGIAFLVTAALLYFSQKAGKRVKTIETMSYADAAVIGVTQGIAVMPGISRSGSTTSAGLFLGMEKEDSLRFAFLMSIPVILGSAVMGVKDVISEPASIEWLPVIVGMIAAGISGYFAVRFMLNFFKKRSLNIFAVYVAILGILILADQLFFQKFFTVFLV